jgi:PHP family Zn ribbon phosphoesterase
MGKIDVPEEPLYDMDGGYYYSKEATLCKQCGCKMHLRDEDDGLLYCAACGKEASRGAR